MNRRRFLQDMASTAATVAVARAANGLVAEPQAAAAQRPRVSPHPVDVSGHNLLAEFDQHGTHWKVYEDLRARDGVITFTSPLGNRVLSKTAEAAFQGDEP